MTRKFLAQHMTVFETVQVWDNEGLTMDRYCIRIGEDIWFMSKYPAYPNGVCTYAGQSSDDDTTFDYLGKRISLDKLPMTVLKQIVSLVQEEE